MFASCRFLLYFSQGLLVLAATCTVMLVRCLVLKVPLHKRRDSTRACSRGSYLPSTARQQPLMAKRGGVICAPGMARTNRRCKRESGAIGADRQGFCCLRRLRVFASFSAASIPCPSSIYEGKLADKLPSITFRMWHRTARQRAG